jgi:hypothetical protein
MVAAMFLRKIVHHLKTQNWTAIGIDLLIVIVGVFIGAQASNWNEERKVRDGERVFLERIRTEMAGDLRDTEGKIAYVNAVLDASGRTDRFIRADLRCSGDCWRVLVDFFVASQWGGLAPERGVYEALRGSTYPYDFELKRSMLKTYKAFHEGAELNSPSEYRGHVRKLIPLDVQRAFWACNRGFGVTRTIDPACPAAVSDAEAGAIVERLRKDEALHGELTFNAAHLDTMARMMAIWTTETRALIVRLDRKLGRR